MGRAAPFPLSGQSSRRPRRGRAGVFAAVLALSLAVSSAAAAPPSPGVFDPGASLGGVRIGMTKAQVKRLWGSGFGRCRSCPEETWYFNYRPFEPQGAGVAFVRGKVANVFTVWQPEGWRTTDGLALGASESEVVQALGSLERRRCSGYQALVLAGVGVRSVFYVYDGALWGFALKRSGLSPC